MKDSLKLVLGLLLLGGWAAAQTEEPAQKDRVITGAVTALLEEAHVTRHPLDDEISEWAFEAYLKSLDPARLHFLDSDIRGFAKYRDDIDDMMRSGELAFAHRVFERFRARVRETRDIINEFLEKPLDLENKEYYAMDGESVPWPKDTAAKRERLRQRLEYEWLSLEESGVDGAKIADRLRKRYDRFVERLGQETDDDILSRFTNAVTTSYDPHSTYMSPKAFEDFSMSLTLEYQGIGALLGEEDGFILIRQIFPGGSAAEDKDLAPKDKILAVGQGKEGPMVDIVGMRISDAVQLIRGKAGTWVRLDVKPAGGGPRKIHLLRRKRIEMEQSAAKGVVFDVVSDNGKTTKVGRIDLPSFYREQKRASRDEKDYHSSTVDLRRILEEFKTRGVDVVVLDLRSNGGGYLPEALGVAGLFLDEGPVVQVKNGRGRIRELDDPSEGAVWTGPLVVLTSRLSASASEIVAGAIRDYDRGLVVGDPSTHGKGTVQTTIDVADAVRMKSLGNLGVLKVTIQQFFLPNGDSTQVRGVPSDVVVPSWNDVLGEGEAELPHALPFARIRPAPHEDAGQVRADIVAALREASAQRVANSPDFKKLVERMKAFRAFQEKKLVPLKKEEYFALQASFNAKDPTAKKAEDASKNDGEAHPEKKTKDRRTEVLPKKVELVTVGKKPSPWMQEILAIASDYVRMLAKRRI